MKIVLHLTFLAVFSGLTSAAFAQFPGGGGGAGAVAAEEISAAAETGSARR